MAEKKISPKAAAPKKAAEDKSKAQTRVTKKVTMKKLKKV